MAIPRYMSSNSRPVSAANRITFLLPLKTDLNPCLPAVPAIDFGGLPYMGGGDDADGKFGGGGGT